MGARSAPTVGDGPNRVFRFTATEANTHRDAECVVTGVAGQPDHYLIFSRSSPSGGPDDWGVHLEFDGQANSGYNCIERCVLERRHLNVHLLRPVDPEQRYGRLDVELLVSDEEHRGLAQGLRAVFVGLDEKLELVE